MVLCAQRADWRKFRACQARTRDRYREKPFSTFVDKVRERRQKQGLDGDVHLLLDWRTQNRLENWIEFQNYHLKCHERLAKKREELKKELDEAQERLSDNDTVGSEWAVRKVNASWGRLEYDKRNLEWHDVLLEWIEQRRIEMDPRHPIPTEGDTDVQNGAIEAIHILTTRQRRSKRPDTSMILAKPRSQSRKRKVGTYVSSLLRLQDRSLSTRNPMS